MLQIIRPLAILFLLASCGGESGTSLDDLNSNAQNPIVLQELNFSVDEDTLLTATLTYQNESLLEAVPTVAISIQTGHGIIHVIDPIAGTFRYTPDQDFNGLDEFSYTVTGPLGKEYTTTASIIVLPVNDSPVLSEMEGLEIIGGTLNLQSAVVTDVEDDPSALSLVSAPDWVTVDGLTISLLPPVSLVSTEQIMTLVAREISSQLASNSITLTVSINPNSVSYSATSQTVSEQDGQVLIPMELANASLEAVTLNVSIAGGSAQEGIDYDLPSTQVTFLAGENTVNLPVNILNDELYEHTESISLLIPTGQAINVSQASTEVLITDNEPPPALSFNSVSGAEGESLTVTFTIPNAIDFDVSAQFLSSPLLSFNPASLTIPAGSLTQDVMVTLIDNDKDEPDKTVQINLENIMNATTNQSLSVSIQDNDEPSSVTFSGLSQEVIEGNSSTITFVLDRASGFDITIPLTLSGTAAQTDYQFETLSVLFSKGETQVSVPFSITEDDEAEGLETIRVSTVAEALYQLANTEINLSIIDNEGVFGVSQFGTGLWLDTEAKGTWGSTTWQ